MRPALLLVDLQRDFLDRPGLQPAPPDLIARCAELLSICRERAVPVLHVHTLTSADGSDRMPHWKAANYWACVTGTPGAAPPAALQPLADEAVFRKQYFSAFGNQELNTTLQALGIDTLIIAGIYLHGCVRSSALDAYERGYDVWIAWDAVASTDSVHAEITRRYLHGRAATFLPTDTLAARLGAAAPGPPATLAVACVDNRWLEADTPRVYTHRNPADRNAILSVVPLATETVAARAVRAAVRYGHNNGGAELCTAVGLLEGWRDILRRDSARLVDAMVQEIGKPVTDAQQEVQRALAHVNATIAQAATETALDDAVAVRYRPRGCVALITPWNNPVAIPVSKLAAALRFGNGVVWKPAPQAARTSMLVMETLLEAGHPPGAANLVFGDADTARDLICDPDVAAVSLTGSLAAGRTAAALCTLYNKPLQAELGGNNAVIVLADARLDDSIGNLMQSAFSFAGQRCTAIRRFIVEQSIAAEFETRCIAAVNALRIGEPGDKDTQIGPLISSAHRARVDAAVQRAVVQGARLLCGGTPVVNLNHGCWYAPTLLASVDPDAAIVQEETFGPVAVILEAGDAAAAIALANRVAHGLVAGVLTTDHCARQRYADALEAGILKLDAGPLAVHPDAPFGGWKASSIGPPEHGRWDRDFYTRPQALYRGTEHA